MVGLQYGHRELEIKLKQNNNQYQHIQGDQKASVHLMITIQKVTSNVQNVPRQSPDNY
jgi:hypothetical protein